jgi:hypothetical protein
MTITATQIKKMDNKMTYIIGYRNLFNILVLAIGSVLLMFSPINVATVTTTSFVIFVLGAKWFLTQLYENIDTIAISEL